MKLIKKIGLFLVIVGAILFVSVNFSGHFKLTQEKFESLLSDHEKKILSPYFSSTIIDKEFSSSFNLGNEIISIYNHANDSLRQAEAWGEIMYTSPKDFAVNLSRASNLSAVATHTSLYFLVIFGIITFGCLIYLVGYYKQSITSSTANNGIFKNASTNRGWSAITIFTLLVLFYVVLYFYPYVMLNSITLVDPVKQVFISTQTASHWFLYGFLYCYVMLVMGIKAIIKYKHNQYQILRTLSVLFFQIVFAFLLVEILPLFNLPARDLKNAWPLDYSFLFEWNVQQLLDSGNFGKFLFVWGIAFSLVIIPVLVYFYGKRWYCSWVCGCGGLAETMGDSYRHLSSKKLISWKIERYLIHGVLVFVFIMTVFTGYLTYNTINHPNMESKDILFGFSAYTIREWYGFFIGSIFAGVVGTGFYPILGNRTWCRFGCPLAAYMGLVQRFKSRFRITTNGGQCISCGNCSTYCEQGIDVRAYAQKGQNIVRASCVGCGICASVCPRGVLKLENGPEEGRYGNEGPIVFGNNGFELKN